MKKMKRFLGYDRLQVGGCSHLAEAIIHNHKAMKKLFAFFVLVVVSTAVHAQKYHYDVNGDGMVNVSDVTTFVNNILGVPNGGEEEKNYVYDVNGDGMANVTDVTCLVNKILGILNPGEDTKPCLTCPDDHHPHMIDLGLPSGTKWACCNVDTENPGNQSPSNYGGHYAWAETEVKDTYNKDTYAYINGHGYYYLLVYGNFITGTEYDVAQVKWGDSWVTPTSVQMKELMKECTYKWTTMNGVDGGLFTGPNGGTIFLPAAGICRSDNSFGKGSEGYYWSSSEYTRESVCKLYFKSGEVGCNTKEFKFDGYSVRPVSCPRLQLSTDSLRLVPPNAKGIVTITSGSGSYDVDCRSSGVFTTKLPGGGVNNQLTVYGQNLGQAYIIVTDLLTGQIAKVEVIVSTCPDDHHPHIIDLGLPSGTKWACCNVDAENPETQSPTNHGGCYAWGETEVKKDYTDKTYSYVNIGSDIAGTLYDVAHVKWCGTWVMPSMDQFKELRNNCTYRGTTVNGVNGGMFTSKENGKSIFLPAAGYRRGGSLYDAGSYGYYWSSTQHPSDLDYAYGLYFSSGNTDRYNIYRYYGQSVRPVSCPLLQLSTSSLSLAFGAVGTVEITSGCGRYTVESSDPGVATATLEGAQVAVSAISCGTAVVTVTDTWTRQKEAIEVVVVDLEGCPDDHHPHLIDLGLPSGTKWACCNVDTENPENQSPTNYGGYYAWGETEVKSNYSKKNYSYLHGNIDSDIAGTRYDVAHVKWGGTWVMPSHNQTLELMNNCTYRWTTVNGVSGGMLTSRKNGKSIFLPAAGYRWDGSLYDDGSRGDYWSSTEYPATHSCAYELDFYPDNWRWVECMRNRGHCVRPVYGYFSLSATSLRLTLGAVGTRTVGITSVSGRCTVESSDPGVATATLEGSQVTVTATGLGDAVVTVKDMISGQKATIHVNATLCPDDHHPHLIDLGLPSGTKWACCNVDTENPGKQSPTNYGGYYAWGETDEKGNYSWSNYTHCSGSANTCRYLGLDIAGTQYDVAHVKWGGAWVMPSLDQFKELRNNCAYYRTTRDGVKGGKFVSKANGRSIFLPAAGFRVDSGLGDAGVYGYCWLSTGHSSETLIAYFLYFHSGGSSAGYNCYCLRSVGHSIRPVFCKLSLSATSLHLTSGAVGTVEITLGCGHYTVESSDPDVATATLEGSQVTVTATGLGDAVVTVKDMISGQKATIHVNATLCPDDHHPHLIDLGLPSGTKWACCNVDTENPENQSPTNYGGYYAWGETEVKSNYSKKNYSYLHGNIDSDIAGTRYDVAHVKWGGTWVMPSLDQFKELINNCTYKYTTVNGVNGGVFTSKENGKSIFLPAAGYRWGGGFDSAGSYGCYWSSAQNPSYSDDADGLYFNSGDTDWDNNSRSNGQSVRPISGK